jgi:hypothetical protein
MTTQRQLTEFASVTLDSSGAGTATLGPDAGPANWQLDTVIVQTDRPGVAPVPRCQVYLDRADPSGAQGLTYDGSFSQGSATLTLARGQHLIAVWSGGQLGDQASITVTGVKW